jgi:glycosyltransferase involved in cell wall biosynthesis
MCAYLVITPAHNEETLLPNLIDSLAAQVIKPKRWILIDDGSEDRTPDIVDEAASQISWIKACHLPQRQRRAPGGESVVTKCLRSNSWEDCEHLLRVDADVTFGPDYVIQLLEEFVREPRLGIASGMLYEQRRSQWQPLSTPRFHTSAPSKIYSRACFAAIGGIEADLGWDTIDDARALMRGYITRHFSHIPSFHHRRMGSAKGLWRGRLNMGKAAYKAGYLPAFMAARALRHAFAAPWSMGGALMMTGYLWCWMRREPLLAEPELAQFIRAQQWRRLTFMPTVWR